jgi:hypothetical protein
VGVGVADLERKIADAHVDADADGYAKCAGRRHA